MHPSTEIPGCSPTSVARNLLPAIPGYLAVTYYSCNELTTIFSAARSHCVKIVNFEVWWNRSQSALRVISRIWFQGSKAIIKIWLQILYNHERSVMVAGHVNENPTRDFPSTKLACYLSHCNLRLPASSLSYKCQDRPQNMLQPHPSFVSCSYIISQPSFSCTAYRVL